MCTWLNSVDKAALLIGSLPVVKIKSHDRDKLHAKLQNCLSVQKTKLSAKAHRLNIPASSISVSLPGHETANSSETIPGSTYRKQLNWIMAASSSVIVLSICSVVTPDAENSRAYTNSS